MYIIYASISPCRLCHPLSFGTPSRTRSSFDVHTFSTPFLAWFSMSVNSFYIETIYSIYIYYIFLHISNISKNHNKTDLLKLWFISEFYEYLVNIQFSIIRMSFKKHFCIPQHTKNIHENREKIQNMSQKKKKTFPCRVPTRVFLAEIFGKILRVKRTLRVYGYK